MESLIVEFSLPQDLAEGIALNLVADVAVKGGAK